MRLARIVMRNKIVIPKHLALAPLAVRFMVEGLFEGG